MCKFDLTEKLKHYQEYHTKLGTRLTHFIGIPLVIFAIMTITSWIHIRVPGLFDISLMWILAIAALVYYFLMDVKLAAMVTVMFLVFTLIISWGLKEYPSSVSVQVFIYTLILGVVLQVVGHLIEKRKPALLDDLKLALIAPMFLAAELMPYLGLKNKTDSEPK